MKKKFLITLVAVYTILFAFCMINASAETEGIYTYTISNGEATITRCNTSATIEITIPDTLGGYPVTSIGEKAFHSCYGIKSITIPDSVTSIGVGAFYHCGGIKSITIPDSVTTIGDGAFESCNGLESITIPDGITSIGEKAFYWCSGLKSITIPDSVTSIGDYAFHYCDKLESITIPDSVTIIDDWAFHYCKSLENITIPDSVTTIGFHAFAGCEKLESIIIPDSVTSISDGMLVDCDSLVSITIPDSVTSIKRGAFANCNNLVNVIIPDSVTSIDKEAFRNCTSFKDVYYKGKEAEWNKITIDGYRNEYLTNATIHFEHKNIDVSVYGKRLAFEQPPVIENDRIIVPLRAIFEALGAEVTWHNETQTVSATRNDTYIELQIDSKEMKVNNEIKYLDMPAKIINSRTMVPARAIAEAFGLNVNWDAENRAVIID